MRTLLILTVLLAAGAVAKAQNPWRTVAPPSVSALFLTGVDFPTPATGYVVGWGAGKQAVILTSADSGSTWTGAATTGFILYGVHFTTAGKGVVAAYNYDCKCGAIVRTADGGQGWTTMTFPGTGSLQSLSFPDAAHGFAASDDGAILKTTDGGDTWLSKKAGDISFAKIFFTTPTAGYALTVGSGGRPSQIRKTTDGGDTWTLLGDFSTTRVFGDIAFTGSATGFVVGMENGLAIYKTTDGGDHWERRYAGPNGEEQLLNAVHFADERNGFAAGNDGKVLRTKDGGDTWTLETSGTVDAIKGIRTISPKVAVAVGDFGTMVKRYDLDAGQTPSAIIDADGLDFGDAAIAGADIVPNPIASQALLRLHLSASRRVTAALYDPAGRLVRTLHDGPLPAGVAAIAIDAAGLASGSYRCVVATESGTIIRPVTIVH